MSVDQVVSACGQPLLKQESQQPVNQKINMQQLMYNNQGSKTAFYGVWNMPTGQQGVQLEVDVVNNIVKGIKINNSDSNAFSVCHGVNIQAGDPVSKVYGACGNPSIVNNTFINQPIASDKPPEVWVYQPGRYQPSIRLTFVNGKLQSINN
jgi:hypothetical protein